MIRKVFKLFENLLAKHMLILTQPYRIAKKHRLKNVSVFEIWEQAAIQIIKK
jgi:hypothetical protein